MQSIKEILYPAVYQTKPTTNTLFNGKIRNEAKVPTIPPLLNMLLEVLATGVAQEKQIKK